MSNLFSPVVDVVRGSVNVQSLGASISGLGSGISVDAAVVSGTGLLVKNGVVGSTTTRVTNGDVLAVRIPVASTEYLTATHVVITLDGVPHSFSCVTEPDLTDHLYLPLADIPPAVLTKNQDGSDFVPDSSTNKMALYSQAGASLKKIVASAPGTNSPSVPTVPFYSALLFSDSVLKFDATARTVLSSIRVGSRPFAIAPSYTSPTDATKLYWVTVSGLDKVVCLNSLDQVVAQYQVGVKPLGIASSADGAHVWIANYGTGTVSHFKHNGTAWTSTTVQVGGKPYEVRVDASGNAWVTDASSSSVFKITPANSVFTYVVGSGPRGLCIDQSGNVWVACGKDGTVVKLTSAGVVSKTIPVGIMPVSVTQGVDGGIYVSVFGTKSVVRISGDAVASTIPVGAYPHAVNAVYDGSIWVSEYYFNTPKYTYVYDQVPVGIGLTSMVEVPKSTPITSNLMTIAGVGAPTPVSVPPMLGAVILKNGSSVGTSTTVVNDDTLAVQFVTPNAYVVPVELPIFVGSTFAFFLSVTSAPTVTPHAFSFTPSLNDAGVQSTSNTITVSGLSEGVAAACNVSGASLVKNGTVVSTSTTVVVNGDTLAVTRAAPTTPATAIHATVTIGEYTSTWTVVSKSSSLTLVKAEFQGRSIYEVAATATDAAINGANAMLRINTTSKSVTPFSLYSPTVTVDNSQSDFLNAVSPYEGNIYRTALSGKVAEITSIDKAQFVPYEVAYAPKFALLNGVATRRFATLSAASASGSAVVRELGSSNADIALPSQFAYGIDSTKDGKYIYVSTGNQYVARLVRNDSTGVYTVDTLIDCFVAYPQSEKTGLRDLVVDALDRVWVSDVKNSRVICIIGSAVSTVTVLPSGSDPWGLGLAGDDTVWVAASFSNSVYRIRGSTGALTASFQVSSVPTCITQDPVTGFMWVGHFADSKILIIDPANGVVGSVDAGQPVHSMIYNADSMWVLGLYKDLATQQDRVEIATSPTPVVFIDTLDVVPNAHTVSNNVVIGGLNRPASISVSPAQSQTIYKNDQAVGNTTTVFNGDIVRIELDARSVFGDTLVVNVALGSSVFPWRVQTLPDVVPKYMEFDDIYNVSISDTRESSLITISEITEGVAIRLSVKDCPDWTISVNGVGHLGEAYARLDDQVSIRGPFHGLSYAVGEATYELQFGESASAVTFAHQVVYPLVIDGPVFRPYREVHTWASAGWTRQYPRPRFDSALPSPSSASRQVSLHTSELHMPISMPRQALNVVDDAVLPTVRPGVLDRTFDMPAPSVMFYPTQVQIDSGEFIPRPRSWRVEDMPEFEVSIPTKVYVRYITLESMFTPGGMKVLNEVATVLYDKTDPAPSAKLAPFIEYDKPVSVVSRVVDQEFDSRHTQSKNFVVAKYERSIQHERPTVSTPFSRNVLPKALEVTALYSRGLTKPVFPVDAAFTRRTRSEVYPVEAAFSIKKGAEQKEVEASFDCAVRRNAHSTELYGATRNAVYGTLVAAAYAKHVHTARIEVEVSGFERYEHVHRTAPLPLQPMVFSSVKDSGAPTIDKQGLYATSQLAIDAGVSSGYEGVSSWQYTTVVSVGGVLVPTQAYMWTTPPDVLSKDCAGGPGSKYPIPQAWYVSGG